MKIAARNTVVFLFYTFHSSFSIQFPISDYCVCHATMQFQCPFLHNCPVLTMDLGTELAELDRRWNSLLDKFDNLDRVNLLKIVIAKAEKMLEGRDSDLKITNLEL